MECDPKPPPAGFLRKGISRVLFETAAQCFGLVDDASKFVTGTILPGDGGFLAFSGV
jgi:hypothetical protein